MEAKNTVVKTTVYNCHNTLEERLLEQAKVSFKAGEKQGIQEGGMEVVEWLETGAYFRNADKLCIHGYKAFKKEKGL